MRSPLDFEALRAANVMRYESSFHPVNDWSPTDWACSLAGEVGEACNDIKKAKRIADSPEIARSLGQSERAMYALRIEAVGKELADVICYLDLLAARLGIDLSDAVRAKFNEVSCRVGSTVKL